MVIMGAAPTKTRDAVLYVPDPLLFGEMEVHTVRPDGRVVCRLDPDSSGPPRFELFEPAELEPPSAER